MVENSLTQISGNVIIRDNQILLIYREDKGYWEVPGGKVRKDESPTETAVREAREEIGVEVELEKPFFSGEFQHEDQIFLWHGYISEIVDGKPGVREEKFSELDWFGSDDLTDLELAPNLRMIEPSLTRILD